MNNDLNTQLIEQVADCIAQKTTCHIQGNGSHGILSEQPLLELKDHRGIIHYEPSELVITVRAGTLISEIKQLLKENNQQLGTDFPDFAHSTIGGAVALGVTGSARPFWGAIRDQVLGLKIINGQAQLLNFGGQVMKNVAGYDVSRLLCGSMGQLAIISEVSLKVAPLTSSKTIVIDTPDNPLEAINQIAAKPLPISAIAIINNQTLVRLCGSRASNQQAQTLLQGTEVSLDEDFWNSLDNYSHEFFKPQKAIWEVRLPATQALPSDHTSLINWCGNQRFIKLKPNDDPAIVFKDMSYKQINAPIVQRNPQFAALKQAFDPHHIFQ